MSAATKLLVTGASGYIGGALCRVALQRGFTLKASSRRPRSVLAPGVEECLVVDGAADSSWSHALAGVDAVVHLAGQAHVLRAPTASALSVFRENNVVMSLALARAAQHAGVRRFVYISSAGIHGAHSGECAFRASDTPAPHNAYTQSKWEAEISLRALCRQSPMELVVIRPPLVYGPGAPGNFALLVKALRRGWPLPLASVSANRRSLIALDNLLDFIFTCLRHPEATAQAWLVSDGEDVSTADLLRRLTGAMGRQAHLFPVPLWMLHGGSKLLGRPELFERLCTSFRIDPEATRDRLGWSAPIHLDEGLRRAVAPLAG